MAKSSIIGLDIGSTMVRAAELRFSAGGPGKSEATLVAYAQAPLPIGALQDGEVVEPATVSSVIKSVWDQGKFSSKDVVIGVGNQRVIVREADIPWVPGGDYKKTLSYQAQELLPTAANDALLDFVPTGENVGQDGTRLIEGLFVAAIRETVVSNVLAAEAGGVRPMVVDLKPFALQRLLTQGEYGRHTVAIVDIGARITSVVIADKGIARFVRVIPHGAHEATDAVAHAMSTTAVEAERVKREMGVGYQVPPEYAHVADALLNVTSTLIESIRSTFVYYSSKGLGSPIEVIAMSGGGSQLQGIAQFVSSSTRLPVQLANPFERIRVGKGVDVSMLQGSEQTAATVLGLAFGGNE